jgi:hypothetical protein
VFNQRTIITRIGMPHKQHSPITLATPNTHTHSITHRLASGVRLAGPSCGECVALSIIAPDGGKVSGSGLLRLASVVCDSGWPLLLLPLLVRYAHRIVVGLIALLSIYFSLALQFLAFQEPRALLSATTRPC